MDALTQKAIALNRFGLGARGGDAPLPSDVRGWLGSQFARYQPRPAAFASLQSSTELGAEVRDFIQSAMRVGKDADAEKDARAAARGLARDGYGAQVQARLTAALTTPAPFAERLAHFWGNHFAVSADKLVVLGLAGTLELEAVRATLFGRFEDMLLAVERHPSMLLYLDQAQSVGPNSRLGQMAARRQGERKVGLNENLAREILELHTLGVGNYSQQDVTELARALTGWSIGGYGRGRLVAKGEPGRFAFQDLIHEPGTRTLLGKRYPEGGEGQAAAMLRDLARHPKTAQHVATKLARHFVADVPPQAAIDRLTRAYLAGNGDLRALYRALIDEPLAWATATPKFRDPWDWTVAALRGVGASTAPPNAPVMLSELGQPVWRPGSPAGWPDDARSWAAPDALVRRVEVAQRMAAGAGAALDPRARAEALLPGVLTAETRQAIARAGSPAQGVALLLVSPEFLRR